MSEKDLGVTGQPAPPTPLRQTPWFTVPAGLPGGCPVCDRTTCYDESHNPSRPQLAQLMEKAKKLAEGDPTYTTLIAIEGVIGEALRLLAAAQPLTPPRPPRFPDEPYESQAFYEQWRLGGYGDYRAKFCRENGFGAWVFKFADDFAAMKQAAPPSLTAPLDLRQRAERLANELCDGLEEERDIELIHEAFLAAHRAQAASLTAEELAQMLEDTGCETETAAYWGKRICSLPAIKVVRG